MAHMCGHDGHMATMVGVTQILQANISAIPSVQNNPLKF